MNSAIKHRVQALETVYRRIHRERMADLPLANPAIGVHAIGFRPWNDDLLGVLVTPWCMNLMSLPRDPTSWANKPDLSEETLTFPSGRYRFIVGSEAGIGKYRMCSLFSSMFDFANDQAAVETAQAVMRELLNDDHRQQAEIDAPAITALWRGEPSPRADEQSDGKRERLLSRRELLQGAFLKRDDTR